VKINSLP